MDVELGEAFGGSHDGDGVDGFVGADEDKTLDAGGMGGVCDGFGAEEIVGDGCCGVVLHHWDMFVGSGVKDELGSEFLQELTGGIGINHVMEEGLSGKVGVEPGDLAIDLEQGVFGSIHEQELTWLIAGDDTSQFAADGAACPGDEEFGVADDGADGVFIHLAWGAVEQCCEVDFDIGAGPDACELVFQSWHEAVGDAEAT